MPIFIIIITEDPVDQDLGKRIDIGTCGLHPVGIGINDDNADIVVVSLVDIYEEIKKEYQKTKPYISIEELY